MAMRKCPVCDAEVSPTAEMCGNCGVRIETGSGRVRDASAPSSAVMVGIVVVTAVLLGGCLLAIGGIVFLGQSVAGPIRPDPASPEPSGEMFKIDVPGGMPVPPRQLELPPTLSDRPLPQ